MAGQSKDTGPPILFMKTGILGAEPRGFYKELASVYEATLISRQGIYIAGGGTGRPAGSRRKHLDEEARRSAHGALLEGTNVIYDRRLNNYTQRETVRQVIARPAGARTILLCVQAPLSLMQKRLVEKAQAAHPDDAEQREDRLRSLEKAMYSMIKTIEGPRENEPHLNLNGELPAEVLVRQTHDYVAQLAIAPVERPE